ncbi:MAG: Asp-tRNA(Asn)/Glu-tRNA(Gln) amidotransferase subunit GatB [Bacillota bacterium]
MSERQYEMLIGLEVHAELATQTKMFCRCPSRFGDPPNTNVCPVCLGLPGSLPVPNLEAVRLGVRAALALDCQVNFTSSFDRKNYFYPDLPKGYQITQYERPLATGGHVEIGDPPKRIRIRRLHLEEDAGKSVHEGEDITTAEYSLVDHNRCGVPLVEIVSEPDMISADEARQYLETLQKTLQFAKVSDVKMEEGSMRVDCNISVNLKGEPPGVPVELKNLSSFRAVVRSLGYEFKRQSEALDRGEKVTRETRHWDEVKEVTGSMRTKESSQDYRYFPEPDLPGLTLTGDFVAEVRSCMPRLPAEIVQRYVNELGLSAYDAGVLTLSPHLVAFLDACVEIGADPKVASNWIAGDLLGYMKAKGIPYEKMPVSPQNLASMLGLIKEGLISGKIGKDILAKMIETGRDPRTIVAEEGLEQVSGDSELAAIVDSVLDANPAALADFRSGKDKALGFLVGQVMKATRGRANPAKVNVMLKEKMLSR